MSANTLPRNRLELKAEWERNTGAEAIRALVAVCFQHQGDSTYPLTGFLLGLYNGALWKPDMQLLCRRTEDKHFSFVLDAMKFVRQTNMEPHEVFVHGSGLFERLKEFAP